MGDDLTSVQTVVNRLARVQAERDALAGPLEELTHEYVAGRYGGCTRCGTADNLPVHQTPGAVYAALGRQREAL